MRNLAGLAGLLALGLTSTACYRSRVETTVTERNLHASRTPLEADGELTIPVWHFREEAILSRLEPGTCRATRDWVRTETRTTTRTPEPALAGIGIGVGVLTGIIGAATIDLSPDFVCDGVVVSGTTAPPYARSCEFRDRDNTVATGLLVTSAAFMVLGTVGMLQSPTVTQEVVAQQPHHVDQVEPCISARELAELVLAVRGPTGQLWPVQLSPAGQISISTQQSPALPRGVELELVVFAPPRTGRQVLSRGQVLDTFELPSE